ncbi:SLC13 family permease [Denitromonas ohlonensis]|uniref:SLC13/DASS family transporter n=2 Tax=Denitromonas TaxID=139331 RepID=A0A557SE57_9RHOO|nr:SLC13 family permease [Denitromonas ohlonensis]TVO65023.1 SLC13/DASS family transporter [Denitromonas ohlonensis]TVO75696.1 SLC13/DASS family transporter [Denitromonas ohlonensis]
MRTFNLGIAVGLFLGLNLALTPSLGATGGGLALVATIAWLWTTEALHVSVTAVLVPLLAAVSGVLPFDGALRQFADPVIFLFLGGFALAAGLQRQGLDRWMAAQVIRRAGNRLDHAARWLFGLTAFLSMWISNTATAAMMLPLALGLLASLPIERYRSAYLYVLLGVAFSANIGGIGTLVGSPPNAIAAAQVGLGFAGWLVWGLPLVLVLMPLMEVALRFALKPDLSAEVELPPPQAAWPRPQKQMLALFGATVLLWVFGAPLNVWLEMGRGYDAAVAVFALVMLHALRLTEWKAVERSTDWGVLLLFGGGLTLSRALAESGAAAWLAAQLGGPLETLPAFVCLALMVLFAMLITEVTSNTASAALLIPLFIGLAPQIDSTPLAVLVAVGTSCAFLLPVATPPNAIVFGSGHVPQRVMIRAGLWVSLLIYPVLVAVAAGMLALV